MPRSGDSSYSAQWTASAPTALHIAKRENRQKKQGRKAIHRRIAYPKT